MITHGHIKINFKLNSKMGKFPIFLLFFLFLNPIFSQSACYPENEVEMVCDDTQWNWWQKRDDGIDECSMWNTLTHGIIENPFRESSGSGASFNQILTNKDYLPSGGWELAQRNFGCIPTLSNAPSFILYNRNSNLYRAHILIEDAWYFNSYVMYATIKDKTITIDKEFAIYPSNYGEHYDWNNRFIVEREMGYTHLFIAADRNVHDNSWIAAHFIPIEKFEEINDPDIIIWPIPVKNKLNIVIQTSSVLEIIGMNGKTYKRLLVGPNTIQEVDLQNLSSGIYFANFISDNNTQIRKIIIE